MAARTGRRPRRTRVRPGGSLGWTGRGSGARRFAGVASPIPRHRERSEALSAETTHPEVEWLCCTRAGLQVVPTKHSPTAVSLYLTVAPCCCATANPASRGSAKGKVLRRCRRMDAEHADRVAWITGGSPGV